MVPKDVFLKVNDLLSRNTQGYSCHEENEPIPLKRFLKCGHCETPMRGYIIKGKNLPYYKCNTKGCCNNKSATELHGVFESGLSFLPLAENLPVKKLVVKQIIACYNKTHQEKEADREALKRQVVEVHKKIERLEERLIMEEITLDLYKLCANLRKVWHLLPYKDKQIFQNLVFPEGIWYNKKTGECRTTKINSVFRYIAHLAGNLAKIKMGESKLIFDIPHLVVPPGISPGAWNA